VEGMAMNQSACCCLEQNNSQRYSVQQVSRLEADQFKWIESQKVGRDLGEFALQLWIQKHWWGFLRARLIEHLQGARYWSELDMEDFGLLNREFLDQQPLLNAVVAELLKGKDNLEVIIWAHENQKPIDNVLHILERININARRLILEYNSSLANDPDKCWSIRR
jgi:hypothetical protein